MKLSNSMLLTSALASQNCQLADHCKSLSLYGCTVRRDNLDYPGDNGSEVYNGAKCRRAVCQRNKHKIFDITCHNGVFSPSLDDFCQQNKTTPSEGNKLDLERQFTYEVDENAQTRPKSYPQRVIVFGSYTPGRLDGDSFKGIGNYIQYNGKDVKRMHTDSKPIYRHETDPNLFLSFTKITNEWRITTRESVNAQKAFCVFSEKNGILHDPSVFSSTTQRQCFIKGQWTNTDLTIVEAPKSGLVVRTRACSDATGELRAVLQGTDWQFDINLQSMQSSLPRTDYFVDFEHSFDRVLSVDTVSLSDHSFCLSEFSLVTPKSAINLLLTSSDVDLKADKKSGFWPTMWWDSFDKESNEISNFERQFLLPKPLETFTEKKPVGLQGKQKFGKSQATAPVLHCDVTDYEKKYGLHFSKCRISSTRRPVGSSTNQARFGNKIANGSTCKMSCGSYPKSPFRHKKMVCKCSSSFRSNFFTSLSQLASSPLALLFQKCHWYDGTKKRATSPIVPMNVFGIASCPAGCHSGLLKAKSHSCPPFQRFNKICTLNCPNRQMKTRCIIDKKTKMPRFSNDC